MKVKEIKISRTKRIICFFLAISLLFEIISPTVALALTSGPAQEEFGSFEPSTTTDMVDLYTGDFNYNIPIMSVPGPNGGYPLNLAYHSGVGMEQEASWVGLGWSLNVGAINRQLRGLPDDFSGELIEKRQHMKESWAVGLDIPTRKYREVAGFPVGGSAFQNHFQIYYNNYKGMGYRYLAKFAFPNKGNSESAPVGLNVGFDSQNGLDMELDLSLSGAIRKSSWKAGFKAGLSYNSLQGLKGVSFGGNIGRPLNHIKSRALSTLGNKMSNSILSSELSFASNMNVPETRMQTKTTTVPFNLKIAKPSKMLIPANFPAKFPLLWSGYVSKTKMVNNGKVQYNAYGYLNDLDNTTDDVMRDFNRDNLQYSKKVPNLPMSSFTYDIFNQSGQGTGSNFRAYQNQIHVLRDPSVISKESSYDAELEFGLGAGLPLIFNATNLHVGLAFNYGSGENRSGYWKQIKNVADVTTQLTNLKSAPSFPNTTTGNFMTKIYERNYFKAYGEKTGFNSAASTSDLLNTFSNEDALRFEIEKEKNDINFLNRHYKVTNNLIKKEGQSATATIGSGNYYINSVSRAKRANNIEYVTHQEASKFGYSRNEKYYNAAGTALVSKFPSTHGGKHLSEISVLQADGMRYVYGIATYNTKQVDNVFSSKTGGTFNTNQVNITSGSIEGIDIKGTYEEYMERNQMPEYANGWLLTTIFSADYLDLTNDGPTDDDYGFWVKFNYSKAHSDFKWRSPYVGANFMEGNRNDPNDDKASYTYGEKEIYFIHSIESKTHLAKFITSDRRDAIEAPGELSNSGIGARAMKKLDKIQLFAKKDIAVNGTSAKPIKAVNFVYSYELCPGVPNNNGTSDVTNNYYDETGNYVAGTTNINTVAGKLTLKQVYFTYQNSSRSQLSPYIFKYGTTSLENPSYERRNMDRWGNYNNNTVVYSGATNSYAFIDNPYTPQDPNFYSASNSNRLVPGQWSLKQILLPTGGTINVDYEFDDYYYEETEKAMRMYDIIGCFATQSASRNSTALLGDIQQHTLYFNLEDPVANVNEFYQKYISKLPKNQVYYKVYAEIKGMLNNSVYDYVSGYAEIDNTSGTYGINGAGTVGFVTLKKVPLSKLNAGGTMISPIARAIIEHTRANRSELLHSAVPYATTAKAQILNVLGSVTTIFSDLMQAATGFNRWANTTLYGGTYKVKLNGNSIIRLCDPDEKIGGGIRVKKLSMADNWKNGTTNDISNYGQTYDYTMTDASGNKISSGVAYEPQMGSEESALRTAIKFPSSSFFKSNYDMMVETPIAKSHYPGESVGYSKVTVTSIGAQEVFNANGQTNLPSSNTAPISVYEFYTAKDFPVIVKETDNGPYGKPIYIPIPILGLFTTVKRRQAKSQGYTVILNDMAGKPKSTAIYTAKLSSNLAKVTAEPDKLISKQNFIYSTKQAYNPNAINELDNKVQTISVNTSYQTVYQTATLGQTHDMYVDMNENSQEHTSFGATGNLDMSFFVPVIPFVVTIPWVIPSYHKTTNSMRTVVFNKIIHRTGILTKVETTTDKSTLVSENLAFDIETGQPLLTKVTNEFKDPIYNFSFPGHWYYKNLGAANRNLGFKFSTPNINVGNTSNSTGVIPIGFASSYFTKGDVVYIESANPAATGLYHVYTLNSNSIHCVDKNGNYFPASTALNSIQIVRSGYRNQQNVQVGALAFKQLKTTANVPDFVAYDPTNTSTFKTSPVAVTFDNATDNKIVNASATELSDDWQMQCGENTVNYGNQVITCTPISTGLFNTDFIAFLTHLKNQNLLFAKDVPVVQNNNPAGSAFTTSNLVYSNNFTAPLNASFQGIMRMSDYVPISQASQFLPSNTTNIISNGKNLYYSGFISPITKNYVIIFSNTLIGNTTNDPNSLCSDVNFQPIQTGFDRYPIKGIKFGIPTSIINSVTNTNSFWTNFIANVTNFNFLPNQGCTGLITTPSPIAPPINGLNTTVNLPGFGNVLIHGTCNFCVGVVPVTNALSNNSAVVFYCRNCIEITDMCTITLATVPYTCGTQSNQVVNPYQNGMKGIWRAKRSYAYNTARTQTENVREDGVLTSFMRFPWESTSTKDAKWIEAATITKYNQQGFEIENRNAIGNFSGALYGYGNSLNTGVANNARYTDIAFDGFEDYPKPCDEDHLGFSKHSAQVVSGGHTGKYAIKVNTNLAVVRDVFTNCDNYSVNGQQYVNDNPSSINTSAGSSVAHIVKPCDCIGKFNPQLNKKYVISAWVSEDLGGSAASSVPYVNYSSTILIEHISASNAIIGSQVISTMGGIIDGWQRLYGEFTLPTGTVRTQITLVKAGSGICLFDDIKIQPFDASMKAFVYDAVTSKVLAELDDNNYATIYNYDDEGNLIKVKRETEKGIKTIKEGRINSKKLSN